MARRAIKTRPDPPDLAPRRDPAPAVLESSALWDGVDAGADVEVPEHVAGVRLRESRWVGADLSGRRLSGFECRDTAFVNCDLSGVVLEDAVLTRVTFSGCRLTGVVLSGATLRDVHITEGRADLALLRMAKARHLWIEDTSLRGADFYAFEGASAPSSAATSPTWRSVTPGFPACCCTAPPWTPCVAPHRCGAPGSARTRSSRSARRCWPSWTSP
jgi:hypothetical protein